MGGPGSGRWGRWQESKDTVESSRALDIRAWHRRGLLDGWGFGWSWSGRGGERVASIWVRVQPGQHVTLIYRVRTGGGPWQDVEEPVPLTWTPCPFGGRRPWFLCPGVGHGRVCRRRVAILYGAGREFLCRHCYDLVYESQREDQATRLIARAQKIRRRLGGNASLMAPFPPKPKGMHWRTYAECYAQARRAEAAGMQTMLGQLQRPSARLRCGVSPPRNR